MVEWLTQFLIEGISPFSPRTFLNVLSCVITDDQKFSFYVFRVITQKYRRIRERERHTQKGNETHCPNFEVIFSLFIVAINTLRPKRNLFSRTALHCCALVCFQILIFVTDYLCQVRWAPFKN